MSRALKRGLEGEGFAVDIAFTGEDGRSLAGENAYDALVLDVMLPGIGGLELCAALRGGGNWKPILMLTAKDAPDDEAQALDGGADDFLSKPFSYAVLLARLRALLRRGGGARPCELVACDLRLDVMYRRETWTVTVAACCVTQRRQPKQGGYSPGLAPVGAASRQARQTGHVRALLDLT